MFEFIYRLPLIYVTIAMIILIIVWGYAFFRYRIRGYGCKSNAERKFIIFNAIALMFFGFIILKFTVLERRVYIDKLVLQPFYSLVVAKDHPEMYRSLLMNVALFIPFGCSCSCLLSKRAPYVSRIIITSLLGCLLSFIIEFIQYFYKLGAAWTDDVICNAIGAFVGSLAIVVWKMFYCYNRRFD